MCFGLKFTHATSVRCRLQFLDLGLYFSAEHACWADEPRSKKSMFLLSSTRSKFVKRDIASSYLRDTLRKACPHQMNKSFSRPVVSGYLLHIFRDVSETLAKNIRKGNSAVCNRALRKVGRPVVWPFIHKMSHNPKWVAHHFVI